MTGADHVCRCCGRRVAAALYERTAAGCRCENCFLDACRHDAVHAEQSAIAEALAAALDLREHEAGLHSKRVACHALVLARRFTQDRARLQQIYWGSLLHDIGKIGIPDAILLKAGPLTASETVVMRTHPAKGRAILAGLPFMRDASEIVLGHEERFDGSGYPRGLAGESIPFGARLFAVIDALDAMTSDRPYRRALSFDAARAEIERCAGSQFDPAAVAALLAEESILRAMVAVKCDAAVDTGMTPPLLV